MPFSKSVVGVVALFLLGSVSALASPVGSVSGTVKDPSGAPVAGVKLKLIDTATNSESFATTNGSGEFQFLQLAPSTYSLEAESAGFKKITAPAVVVQVDQVTHLELQLQLGSVSESIEVAATAPLLENDKSTLSSVVDTRTIAHMPLNARQYLDLALLTPGAVPSQPGQQGGGFNMAGARSQSNDFLLDGVSIMDTQIGSALGNFRITDAVQEFAVQTSVPSAEFGRGEGAQVSIVTKSGTNQFHGSAFEYFRNSDLDARDFFTNKLGGTKNTLHRNQYGATLGGPIRKDQTFFFVSWEGFRQVNPTVSSTRVPTLAQRAQVTDPISQALLQFWPLPNTSRPGSTINYIANVGASTFDNTGLIKIDQSFGDKDHLSGRWVEYQGTAVTAGVLPGLGGTTNAPVSRSAVVTETHTFSPTLLNEFRFGFSRNQTFLTVTDSGFDASTIFKDASGNPLPGVVNGKQNVLDSGLPTITVSGGFATLGTASNYPQGRITNTYELFDNVSWVSPFGASKHSFRWGFHIRREEARRFLDSSFRGAFSFQSWSDFAAGLVNTSTIHTGSTLAYWRRYPFDLYWQDTYKVKDNLTVNYGIRYEYPSAIYQTRADATNFIPGIGAALLGTNEVLTIDPTKVGRAALVLTPGPVTISNSGVHSDKNNIAPVLGIAYTPRFAKSLFGNDATVIRAGFRVGYDDLFNNVPANMGLNPPYSLTTNQTAGVTQPGKFSWATGFNQNVPLVSNYGKQGPGTPTAGLVSLSAEDPNLRSSYIYQYNFGIQRRLGQNFSIEADYQGSAAHKLLVNIDLNEPYVTVADPTRRGSQAPNTQLFPYQTFAQINMGKDIGNSNYNGLVTTARYQGRYGIFLQASYTYGKSLDDTSSWSVPTGQPGGVADPRDLRLEYGPSNFDIRHRAVITYVVDVPVGPGHRLFGWNNIVNREALGGWQISGITTFQSGAPFTVYNGSADFSGFNQFYDRPDVVVSGKLTQDNRNPDAAFDTAYFSKTPPTGRVGTSGRDQYYGPGLANYDFSGSKNFPLGTERFQLQLRGDLFNIFNHTNFSNPVSNQSSSSFGQITSTVGSSVATAVGTTAGLVGGGPRVVQFSMRLMF
jgi:Carboxypeptidase regulatory-like domain/TonB-dependent Receptor Plug Domain